MKKITIIGAGSFGTALSVVLARAGNKVQLWARESEVAYGINKRHRNPAYISDVTLPDSIECSTDLEACFDEPEMVVFATPSHAMRQVAEKIKPYLSGDEMVVSVAKGIENDTFQTMSQVLSEVLAGTIVDDHIGVISGPSHAEEVSKFKPTTVVASANSKRTTQIIQDTFLTPMFRVYLNYDIVGVEIGGAVKNIMAIAAGILDGGEIGR
ncbi:MAG: 2-dehydropantoate 2-reductase N-terminal domain-containing protein [Fodinibius sp.]|nr:2-dehydropantoate 2-reductase N-terminal domain-containing protein [Fodinibius sp.]